MSQSTIINAVVVNHNTSVFAELAARSFHAVHGERGDVRFTIMDNSSQDGTDELESYARSVGIEFRQSGFVTTEQQVNSHGDVWAVHLRSHRTTAGKFGPTRRAAKQDVTEYRSQKWVDRRKIYLHCPMNPEHMAGPSEPRGINHGELDEEARKQPLMTLVMTTHEQLYLVVLRRAAFLEWFLPARGSFHGSQT
jgi:hypothetical protein